MKIRTLIERLGESLEQEGNVDVSIETVPHIVSIKTSNFSLKLGNDGGIVIYQTR